MVRGAGGDRVGVHDLENEAGRPIYAHGKLCVIDDVWMSVGSDNLNRRSWTHVARAPGNRGAGGRAAGSSGGLRGVAPRGRRARRGHAEGQHGPRSGGRVRRHQPLAVPAWATWWARPLYRLAVDPDGRPRDLTSAPEVSDQPEACSMGAAALQV